MYAKTFYTYIINFKFFFYNFQVNKDQMKISKLKCKNLPTNIMLLCIIVIWMYRNLYPKLLTKKNLKEMSESSSSSNCSPKKDVQKHQTATKQQQHRTPNTKEQMNVPQIPYHSNENRSWKTALRYLQRSTLQSKTKVKQRSIKINGENQGMKRLAENEYEQTKANIDD